MPTLLKDFATSIVAVVEPETTALIAAQLMRNHHVGALVVVDAEEKSKAIGIVSDRDIVTQLIAEELDPSVLTAGDIMSDQLVTASGDMDAMDVIKLMNTHHVRRIIVSDSADRLVGIVTMEDILEFLAQELATFAQGMTSIREHEFHHSGESGKNYLN
jgi:CBS domain-containing protein